MTYLGFNPERLAEHLLFNLEVDPEELGAMTDSALVGRLDQSSKPIRSCRSNGFPILMSFENHPKNTSQDELEARADYVAGNVELRERLINLYLGAREPFPEPVHLEEQIYSALTSAADDRLLKEFHSVPWEERTGVLERLMDERLKALGYRLLCHEAPHVLTPAILQAHQLAFAQNLLNPCEKGTWLNIPNALAELENIIPSCNEAQQVAMAAYESYLRNKATELSAWLE